MEREEFVRKLGVLLDVLTNSNNEHLTICGSDKTEDGMVFFVTKSELYLYDVDLWIGDNMVATVPDVSKDVVLLMFPVYTSDKIKELSIFVNDRQPKSPF